MEKKYIIKESQLLKLISENSSFESYDQEDFAEVFYLFFRPWVQKKHGDEVSKLPLSYLAKKYINEFIKDLNLETTTRYHAGTISSVINVGKEIVRKGLHQLPSMRDTVKFTQRYKKHLETIIQMLGLPNFMQIELKEEKPYEVQFILRVEYPALMNSNYKRTNPHNYYYEFIQYLENYMGVMTGRATHGELDLEHGKTEVLNFEDWQKTKFTKLKNDIKYNQKAKNNLHSIRMKLDINNLTTTIKLIYKDTAPYGIRGEIKNQAREILNLSGQNLNYLKLED